MEAMERAEENSKEGVEVQSIDDSDLSSDEAQIKVVSSSMSGNDKKVHKSFVLMCFAAVQELHAMLEGYQSPPSRKKTAMSEDNFDTSAAQQSTRAIGETASAKRVKRSWSSSPSSTRSNPKRQHCVAELQPPDAVSTNAALLSQLLKSKQEQKLEQLQTGIHHTQLYDPVGRYLQQCALWAHTQHKIDKGAMKDVLRCAVALRKRCGSVCLSRCLSLMCPTLCV